jgi:hypothetical protein
MLKINFSLLICQLIIFSSQAQNLFHKEVGSSWGGPQISHIIETRSGDIVVAGPFTSQFTNSIGFISKFTSSGDTVWSRAIGYRQDLDFVIKVVETHDSAYLVLCAYMISGINGNCCPSYYMQKFNSNGDTLWSRYYGTGSFPTDIAECSDGSFISILNKAWDDTAYQVVKFDSGGNVLWIKSFNAGENVSAKKLIIYPDNSFIVYGSLDNPLRIFNIKSDASGVPQWGKKYESLNRLMPEGTFQLMPDGNIFHLMDNWDTYRTSALITDSMGNALVFKSTYDFLVQCNNVNSDSLISFGGVLVDSTGILFVANLYVKTDLNLNVLNIKRYPYGTFSHPRNILESIDGTFITTTGHNAIVRFDSSFNGLCTGTSDTLTWYADSIITDTFIVTISTSYCGNCMSPYPWPHYSFSMDMIDEPCGTVEIRAVAENDIAIFPTPLHSSATLILPFTIRNARLDIYDVMGKLVRAECINETDKYEIHRHNLITGMYFYQLTDAELGVISKGKIMVD